MAEIQFSIEKELGVLGDGTKAWNKELNLVAWNGRQAKADIRDWNPSHEKMGKGITLTKGELRALKGLLNAIDIDSLDIAE